VNREWVALDVRITSFDQYPANLPGIYIQITTEKREHGGSEDPAKALFLLFSAVKHLAINNCDKNIGVTELKEP
jgi:hypothetical protein